MKEWEVFLSDLERIGWHLISEDDHLLVFSHKRYGEVRFTTNTTQEQILEDLPTDYNLALDFVLQIEGEKSYDRWGKNTSFGITERYYPAQYKEISSLKTREEKVQYAKKFYKKEFWYKLNCDLVEFPLNIIIFDTAVNMGPDDVIRFNKILTKRNSQELHSLAFLSLRMLQYTYNVVNEKNKDKKEEKRKNFLGWQDRCLQLYEKFIIS